MLLSSMTDDRDDAVADALAPGVDNGDVNDAIIMSLRRELP
ncbi:hypothetical protein CPter91_3240 [Collimonas pratensis]|uniref:Uncharacterized protein n=1 Tax=Collimonas pratensis TaxID=279113 RepID=A0A127Q6B6_9BURK|nr:hypothetical protein CPter91_3240 [Collimonas pratensis]